MNHPLVLSVGVCLLAGAMATGDARAQSPPAQDSQAAPAANAAPSGTAPQVKDTQSGTTTKKVYTNEDLKGTGSEGVSATGNSKAQRKPGTNNSAKNEQRGEAYWHSRALRLRNQIEETDREIAQIKANPQNSPSPGNANATTGSTPIYYGGQYGRLKNLEARKAALEKQMENLEEEARKAGVPAGWLR